MDFKYCFSQRDKDYEVHKGFWLIDFKYSFSQRDKDYEVRKGFWLMDFMDLHRLLFHTKGQRLRSTQRVLAYRFYSFTKIILLKT
jgi:hypothetical protein